MPSLPAQWIAHKAADGTKFEYKASCFVTADGEFTIEIHPDLLLSAKRLSKNGVGVSRARVDASERVYCNNLQDGIRFLHDCAKDFMTVKQTTERVIVYEAEFNLAFWKMPDGSIQGNGSGTNAGQWHRLHYENMGKDSNNKTNMFRVGLCAAVYDKVTTIRKSGNIVRYLDPNDLKDGSPAANLNSFTTLDVETKNIGNSYCKTREMPYTDQAATFFYEVMLGMCALAERIDNVIANEAILKNAIASRSSNLLTNSQ